MIYITYIFFMRVFIFKHKGKMMFNFSVIIINVIISLVVLLGLIDNGIFSCNCKVRERKHCF